MEDLPALEGSLLLRLLQSNNLRVRSWFERL